LFDLLIIEVDPNVSPSVLERFKYCPCSKRYPLLESESGVEIYCYNSDCTTQQEKKVHHFFSKQAMNIAGLGPKTVCAESFLLLLLLFACLFGWLFVCFSACSEFQVYTLLDYEAIDNIGDVFFLKKKYDSLVTIPGLGKKSIHKYVT
jgi:hypothetical protein